MPFIVVPLICCMALTFYLLRELSAVAKLKINLENVGINESASPSI